VAVTNVASVREELARTDLEAAERGFLQLLRRKRFSPAFIERHAADLIGRARLEYSKHLAEGGEVRNPVGWIIHCAWRRTQNLLEAEGRAPRVISIDNGVSFANESATPEEEVLTSDRYRRLQTAIEELPIEERKVIALTYFEGMSVREVGRTLKWDKCKADRRHRAALERLQELLGAKDLDSLQIEIGILAWASIAGDVATSHRLPGLGAAIDATSNGLAVTISRGQDLARRLLTGGTAEPGMAPALGGAARTAGVCGAAAVACVASGLVGPGVGGVDVLADQRREKPVVERSADAPQSASPVIAAPEVAATAAPEESANASTQENQLRKQTSKPRARKQQAKRTSTTPSTATSSQVAEEFDPFAGGGETSSSGGSTTSSGGSASSKPSTPTGSSSPSPPPASGQQVQSEFGL